MMTARTACARAALLLGLSAVGVLAQTATQVKGDKYTSNRVTMTVLGDGYTAGRLSKFANDLDFFLSKFFDQEPYREYQPYFNVWRVDMASKDSGASHPGENKDTAFGVEFDCGGVARAMCLSADGLKAVNTALLDTGLSQSQIVVVMSNDDTYGGIGGHPALVSVSKDGPEIMLHELGHSFAALGDEYNYDVPTTCDGDREPKYPNVTKQVVLDAIKWKSWIDPGRFIPSHDSIESRPGLYEGGNHCNTGVFRPSYNSKMRTLGQPFDQINTEVIVKSIYQAVDPIDDYDPPVAVITLAPGESQAFSITPLAPRTHKLSLTWLLDGDLAGGGTTLNVSALALAPGLHSLEAIVRDETPMVRHDPDRLLETRQSWLLAIGGSFP